MTELPPFELCFEGLTGYLPMAWQKRLFDDMLADNLPDVCDLPTGLGKTSVIPIWLVALAHQGVRREAPAWKLPRRLFYVVNRRTVVDQATQVVEEIRARLRCPDDSRWIANKDTLIALRDVLGRLASFPHEEVLGVSTLRGELADNEEWKEDPARPAVVVGTVDMIGSKLLFSGYGDSRYDRSHHAGLVGQDVLIVHDEAHLSPAFSALLRAVAETQKREAGSFDGDGGIVRPVSIMELSATSRANGRKVFSLKAEDKQDRIVTIRLTAKKKLSLVEVKAEKNALVAAIAEEALLREGEGCRVLVYVRFPKTAAEVREAIVRRIVQKEKRSAGRLAGKDALARVGLLTGTIRGYERDGLVAQSGLFKAFKTDPKREPRLEQTHYLVSTSAGEVGVDLDGDHLICDLTTLDGMIQRFGRVNRLGVDKNGKLREATITVVLQVPERSTAVAGSTAESTRSGDEGGKARKKQITLEAAIAEAGQVLRRIARDGADLSPAGLKRVLETADVQVAFAPTPGILPATDVFFDACSLTSVSADLPGRPEVAPYLHGAAEWEPPETFVAWRAELSALARFGVADDLLEEVFDAFPIRAQERLRDRTRRVFEELTNIAQRLGTDLPLVLIKHNEARWVRLRDLLSADRGRGTGASSLLAYATLVLPVEAGGLTEDGTLDGRTAPPENPTALDVAEATATGGSARRRVWIRADDSEELLIGGGSLGNLPVRLRVDLADYEEAADEGGTGARRIAIEYRVEGSREREPGRRVPLSSHGEAVSKAAERIGRVLGLAGSAREALRLAALWHDVGKAREAWQRYACNVRGAEPVAKAEKYLSPRTLGGYRHEFGSLLDAMSDDTIRTHPEKDLILHLIAAHHGWGRPHFDPHAFDHQCYSTRANEDADLETMRRFERLQRRFGRWALAWLESLLKCADIAASRATTDGANGPLQRREVQA